MMLRFLEGEGGRMTSVRLPSFLCSSRFVALLLFLSSPFIPGRMGVRTVSHYHFSPHRINICFAMDKGGDK